MMFLADCKTEEFIDFLEYTFQVDCLWHVQIPEEQLIAELNDILRSDNLSYHITNFVKETAMEKSPSYIFADKEVQVIRTLEYPKVIMRENEVIHTQAIVPTLAVLQKPLFKNANSEYLHALEDYRKGDFGDCLTKCGSALESVMKVICSQKGWGAKENDTASTLVKTVLANSNLGETLQAALLTVPTLRNRLSTSHGAGTSERNVPPHLARFALNSTASAILLLAEEVGYQ